VVTAETGIAPGWRIVALLTRQRSFPSAKARRALSCSLCPATITVAERGEILIAGSAAVTA